MKRAKRKIMFPTFAVDVSWVLVLRILLISNGAEKWRTMKSKKQGNIKHETTA